MNSPFYLPRMLRVDDRIYSEALLLAASRFIVLLAEPGAGKSRLMESLAHQLGTKSVTASRFVYTSRRHSESPLVIDAYDELAKIDESGIYKLLGFAQEANPSHLLISSRSSEWDNAATSAFEECLGERPIIARLLDFDESEQREIFEKHAKGEDFDAFRSEVSCFDLEALLPNPQFLILFVDAYLQSGRNFKDKSSIFLQAIERLAKEANSTVKKAAGSLSPNQKVEASSEVFAKLLLSGSEGVTTSEAHEERLYPLLRSLLDKGDAINDILATRLFKPGDAVDTHRPVHKIVAEYAAADYLTKRIVDPTDALTLENCLPVIAPNSVVRDELRGLLGWMASLGNQQIQKAAIELDPYAVLANGDPSQLEPDSKRLLISSLKEVEEKDPYFRRGDFWRRFSVSGLFSPELLHDIRPLLRKRSDGHLRGLVIELLAGSPAAKHLTYELRNLAISPQENEHIRVMAINSLLGQGDAYNHYHDLAVLTFQADQASLRVAAEILERRDINTFYKQHLIDFFKACADLYPPYRERFEGIAGSRYFLNHIIGLLDLATTDHLLNELTRDLHCDCRKKRHECECRTGISKIVGALLDQYFTLAPEPHDPKKIWEWVRKLNFHESKGPDQSKAVAAMRKNKALRQGIISQVFEPLTDKKEILDTKFQNFDWHCHSGLTFKKEDYQFIVDLAFDTNNIALWGAFIARHQYHRPIAERGPDVLRSHMRNQASQKLHFMGEWAKSNRQEALAREQFRLPRFRHKRSMKRNRRQREEARSANIKYINENLELVKSGRHWGFLVRFSTLVLMAPEKIEEEFGQKIIVSTALQNCLDFIAPHVPSLDKLAKLQCSSKYQLSERILYAACLEILRNDGNLNSVPGHLLLALRTNLDMHYDALLEGEQEALKAEVNRLAFSTPEAIGQFCRHYIEPQLLDPGCSHTQVHWLRDDPVFMPLAPTLALDWLSRFREMPLHALDTLFEIAAEHAARDPLKALITKRSRELLFTTPPKLSQEQVKQHRTFWLLRSFYFLESISPPEWKWLKSDKENIFLFDHRSGRIGRSDHPTWPNLTSEKVEAILKAFFVHWPKVPLPNSWGTGSPKSETAYRFLKEVIWSINSDNPDNAIPTVKRLLRKSIYEDLKSDLKSILAVQERKRALRDFQPPSVSDIVSMLDYDAVVTVEGLRQLVLQELGRLQSAIDGGEFNTGDLFLPHGERLDEEPCTRIIAERLHLTLRHQNITITPEHHLKHDKRCDITSAKILAGKRCLLVTEVKGQWHPNLYEAASNQLNDLYAIHPDAEQQGIYLVLWYGAWEKVAGKTSHQIHNAKELKSKIEEVLPVELRGLIDVFVLDLSNKRQKTS